jgi:Ca2+-binding RTX toxin-like protein
MTTVIQPNQWTTSTDENSTLVDVGGATYAVQNADKAYSFTSPATDTLRFEVHAGDVWSAVDPSSKNRSEIAGTTNYAMGTDIHVSYNWQVEPGAANTAPWMVAGQFHETTNDGKSPPFEIMFYGNNKMTVVIATGSGYQRVYTDTQDIARGHNYAMQIDAKFDATNGYLHMVRDGVTIVDYHGAFGWDNMGSVYWKEGVYRGASSETMAMDYSNLQITTGASGPTTSPIPGGSSSTAAGQLEGGSGNDVLTGQLDVSNHIRGYAGDDSLVGGNQFNDINGNGGADTLVGKSIVGDWLLGGQGSDLIQATASTGHNIVNGNLGDDTLTGGSGGDTLRGGQGQDVIVGGSGADWISGDLGTNTLTGGGGADIFHASANGGVAYITDFDGAQGDRLQLDAGVVHHLSQQSDGLHLVIDSGQGGQAILQNVSQASFQAGWII